ncbi:PREDICTED: tetraspanin-7-like [Amphimedon queenslandica]|uniref:Tetraspanin n=1 Tax=Amphimedon queenslandica TaxID=400682 RepID=A0A1X7V5G3_AMPQE|nr:PREDICTED: tetraspanin-7-like [Amphimedon queenslandica]|eukprot:XP_003385520.1 PREDICTED: tetraspanin-7-like [Amphimedon queenslandica]
MEWSASLSKSCKYEKRVIRCLRYLLVGVNSAITIFGCCVIIAGVWGKLRGDNFDDVTDDDQPYTQIPVMAIVVGIFVSLFGLVGVIGAILANHVGGRIVLGLYGFVLALVAMIEVAAVVTAIVQNDQLDENIKTSMTETFLQYNDSSSVRKTWDTVQRRFKCCGTYNYSSYEDLLDIDPPTSCCISEKNCNTLTGTDEDLFQKGCVEKVENNLAIILGIMAGIVGFAILLQISGVVISCYVAVRGSVKRNNYELI